MQIKPFIAVASWLATSAVALASPPLSINGRVVDSTGEPINKATVMVYHAGVKVGYSTFCPSCYKDCGKRTTTDAAGFYTLAKLDSDLWFQLLVVREGYAPTFIKVAGIAASLDCRWMLWNGVNHVEHQFIAYPAAFHESTPPFSTLTFVKPCAWYFAA